jgi:AAA15 family ATPase/GTPase
MSLVAGAGSSRQATYSFETHNAYAASALRVACIFGPNSAGKSSFAAALNFFTSFIVRSAQEKTVGDKIEVLPFKFDSYFSAKPSEFEITFIHHGALYQYGFSADENIVRGEWLFTKSSEPGTRMRQLFQRIYKEETKSYSWDVNTSLGKREIEILKERTRDNALFLSTAVQNNFKAFMPVFLWVRNNIHVIMSNERPEDDFTSSEINSGKKDKILKFIQNADIKICDIEVKEGVYQIPPTMEKFFVGDELEKVINLTKDMKSYAVKTIHRKKGGGFVSLNLSEESDGTRKLYAYAGPILDVLENGFTIVVDELHSSLHPLMLKYIVELFNDPYSNPNSAQLIFTSHETYVLAKSLLHKDQIWLIEKDDDEQSVLYPLSDFDVRDTDAFQKGYLDGKYGAIPMMKSLSHGK